LRILFITPPNFRFRGATSKNMIMGPAYLTSMLKNDHDVINYDCEALSEHELKLCKHGHTSYDYLANTHKMYLEGLKDKYHPIWKEIEEVVVSFSPDIVGLSTMTNSYPAALIIAKIVKKISKATVIMGGSHPTILSEEVAEDDNVDFVVKGEGENTIVDLVNCIEQKIDPISVRGILYKKDGKIIKTPDRGFIKNLDLIPFPDKNSFLFPERFTKSSFSNILAGRGCPWQCHFCATCALWGRNLRMRSAENIFNEIMIIKRKYGNIINFMDDNFMVYKKTLFDLCYFIMRKNLNISWRCQAHVDTIDKEKLAVIKDAGCWDITLGIESGSDRMLTYINKRLSIKKIMQVVEMIIKSGIQLSVNFMFGLPEETWEDMQKTLNLIKEIPANNIAISKFIPLPGTKLYRDVMNLGLIKDNPPRYEHFDLYSNYYHFPLHISRERLNEFSFEVFKMVVEKNEKTRIGLPENAVLFG